MAGDVADFMKHVEDLQLIVLCKPDAAVTDGDFQVFFMQRTAEETLREWFQHVSTSGHFLHTAFAPPDMDPAALWGELNGIFQQPVKGAFQMVDITSEDRMFREFDDFKEKVAVCAVALVFVDQFPDQQQRIEGLPCHVEHFCFEPGGLQQVVDNMVQSFAAADVPQTISAIGTPTITSDLAITGLAGTIDDVNVMLDVTHTWDEDLDVFLISPTGTRVELFEGVGGDGDHFRGTVFDDQAEVPITDAAATTVYETRRAIQQILHGEDDRLLIVVGPCSVHDPQAALDYAQRLSALRQQLGDRLLEFQKIKIHQKSGKCLKPAANGTVFGVRGQYPF